MEASFTLKINRQERDALVQAVEAMAEEYRHVAGQVISRYLSAGFEKDAEKFTDLAGILRRLVDRVDVNEKVSYWLGIGNKIEAIKAVRAAGNLGLKEAKDYVDNFTTSPDYGVNII